MRARRPRREPKDPDLERQKIEAREIEEWIDEGSLRDEAVAATSRASRRTDRPPTEIDPEVVAEIQGSLESRRAERLTERLRSASQALDRERYEEARRMANRLLKELPSVAAVHEISGFASYRLGRWALAVESLEAAYQLRSEPTILPVLADSYRALERWKDVDRIWREVKRVSPPHDIMAEARIVVAGASADQGDLRGAIKLLEQGAKAPKKVRDHHLRQWYVLGDLHDRAGDTVTATRWFNEIAAYEPDYVDVRDRLRSLGR